MTDVLEYQPIIDSMEKSFLIKGMYDSSSGVFYALSVKIRLDLQTKMELSGEYDLLVSFENIKKSINELSRMHAKTKGNTSIVCEEGNGTIDFKMKKYGELLISLQFNKGAGFDTYLKCRFESDQTIIPLLIKTLKELIS